MLYEKQIILIKEDKQTTRIKVLICDGSIQRMKYMLKKYQRMFAESISNSGFWDSNTVNAIVHLKRQLNTEKNEYISLKGKYEKMTDELRYLKRFKKIFYEHCILPLCLKGLIIDYC